MRRWLLNMFVVFLGAGAGYGTTAVVSTGCASWLGTYDEVNNPKDDVALEKCRTEARAEHQIYQNPDRTSAAYFACTDDAGLPRPTTRPR